MQNLNEGLLFDPALSAEIKDRFYYVDADPEFGQRLFFENSGGSLRLKASVEAQAKYQAFPDCPERLHDRSRALKKVQLHGIDDIMHIVFGASGGALISEMTASQAMFQIVGAILENCPGKSAVTSVLEHPSAYDAVKYYCDKTGKEFRVAQANPKTGGIDVEEIRRVVSPDTCLLSIMYASNITGSIMDMAGIVKAAREINPDIYIVTDAVQHAPHAVLDVDALGVDGATFAPYKFFGTRGMGYGYVSDRVAKLPHRKVLQRPADVWELGSPTPGNFAAMSAVVDYVCWLGGHFIQSDDRRTLFVTGMEHIHLQERALLHTMLEGTQNVPGLRHIPGVHVYVDTEDLTHRDLIVAMGIDGLDMTRCVEEYAASRPLSASTPACIPSASSRPSASRVRSASRRCTATPSRTSRRICASLRSSRRHLQSDHSFPSLLFSLCTDPAASAAGSVAVSPRVRYTGGSNIGRGRPPCANPQRKKCSPRVSRSSCSGATSRTSP